jgi:hypothetical protein
MATVNFISWTKHVTSHFNCTQTFNFARAMFHKNIHLNHIHLKFPQQALFLMKGEGFTN